MTFSADDVVAVITYLVPGFIALKILYVFGFRSKRSDLEWAVWSLIGSAAVAPFLAAAIQEMGRRFPGLGVSDLAAFSDRVKTCAGPILAGPEDGRLDGITKCASAALSKQATDVWAVVIAVGLGVLLGLLLLLVWEIISTVFPRVAAKAYATSWDSVISKFDTAPWVEVTIEDGRRLSGKLEELASDVETEATDLFLTDPAWIPSSGAAVPLGKVRGVWLPRSQVKAMVIVKPS